jgi:hypothetical protein
MILIITPVIIGVILTIISIAVLIGFEKSGSQIPLSKSFAAAWICCSPILFIWIGQLSRERLLQEEAIEAGVAEFRLVSPTSSKTEFHFITQ